MLHLANLCVTCTFNSTKLNKTRIVWTRLGQEKSNVQLSLSDSVLVNDQNRVAMYKRLCKDRVAISPGESLLWDNRWDITLHPQPTMLARKQYYVCAHRAFFKTPFKYKRVKKNIHPFVCETLPVILDDQDKLMYFPHLEDSLASQQQPAPCAISYRPVIRVEQWGYLWM